MADHAQQFSISVPTATDRSSISGPTSGNRSGNGATPQSTPTNVTPGSGEPRSITQSTRSSGRDQSSGTIGGPSFPCTPQIAGPFVSEVARKQEDLVTKYRDGEITKADALFEVQQILECGENPLGRKAAFTEFVSTIESVDILAAASRRRGKRAADGLANQDGRQSDPDPDITPGQANDRSLDAFVDAIGSNSKRQRSENSGDEDSNVGGQDDNERSSGKKKIKPSELPWHNEEKVAREIARPSCQKTQDLLYCYQRDPGWVKRQLIISGIAPPSIPGSEWDAIIRGTAVNLDAVFSSLYHVLPPKEDVGHVGSTEIRFSNPEPAKKVKTAGDWAAAFDEIIEGTAVAFPHRRQELREYSTYIRSQFSAKQPSSHPRIIMLDVAIRNFVAGGQRYLLTDWHEFTRFHSAILAPDAKEVADPRSVIASTAARGLAPTLPMPAAGCTSAKSAAYRGTGNETVSRTDAVLGARPKYLRYNLWHDDDSISPSTADWTETASPLPAPPLAELANPFVSKIISENPSLFAIVTPIKVDVFERLLATHPNQRFVASVCRGLREGFWPFADTHIGEYPDTVDESFPTPKDPIEAEFLRSQRDTEFAKGRFSAPFGTELLKGMYSMPIHGVPKQGSDELRMVTNQSAGPYSLNSMIPRERIRGYPLDNMRHLGDMLLFLRNSMPDTPLTLFKSDVAEAYRLMPMHPYWQVKQVNTVDGERSIDRCNAFGGRASGCIWIAFMGLVLWIARYVRLIQLLLAYSDDNFGPCKRDELSFYPPYNKLMPTNQCRLLLLWDELGIPHKERKQVSGAPLTIIGISVDPNNFTLSLPDTARLDLLEELQRFTTYRGRRSPRFPLKIWQRLAGWLNWSFNVFPLLRPCLANLYAKINEKSAQHQLLYVNAAVRADLEWAARHISESSGVHLIRAIDWPLDSADMTVYCDACLDGFGFWFPAQNIAFYSPVPPDPPSNAIFFFEAFCVACALHEASRWADNPMRLLIRTDSSNTVAVFNSLHALPDFNPILKFAVDVLLSSSHQLHVVHISGADNLVADAISRHLFDRARDLCPELEIIDNYLPPRSLLGASQK
ncbi:hypothetical protein LshimejAT787_2000600 [Lyophyllum shimeji]|uniref:Uncharacterized protein n=1 Tax=Lyophyllum shimeji TaxID=47721 RepID=A0A9P3Q030_LYOSH|nr:hypothetical protein LshimejAT787_2000600 [Lyophyllum shimeji]